MGAFPAIADPRVSLYGDLADAQARHATDLLVEQTTRSFTERVREAAWRDIPVSYILCEHDQAIPPALQEQLATHTHATTYRVASGHSPFLSMPVNLVAREGRVPAMASTVSDGELSEREATLAGLAAAAREREDLAPGSIARHLASIAVHDRAAGHPSPQPRRLVPYRDRPWSIC
jgi:Alpha/beta hydrolase family